MAEDVLLRFHARISSGGRITLPETSRRYLRLKKGDFVKIRIKKVEFDEKRLMVKRISDVVIYGRLASRGQITIPDYVRQALNLKEGDIIEADLLEFSYAPSQSR